MRLFWTLLAVTELCRVCVGDDYPPAYEKSCDARDLSYKGRVVLEEDAAVFRTLMRKRRASTCDCGKGTLFCLVDAGKKYCKCSNEAFVINGSCEECLCRHGVCDETSECRCHEGYGLTAKNTCKACNCGDDMPCKFVEDIKLCLCYDEYISVDRSCRGCNCGTFEMCFERPKEVKSCSCPGKGGPLPPCNLVGQSDCPCTGNDNCQYNTTEVICRCLPNYVKLNGTCTECKCEDENAFCDFQNGEKVCSCKKLYSEHNGTCVECFCGEGHSCEFKNGSRSCICQKDHIEHKGMCKDCICNEGEYCKLVDDKQLCLCKEKHIRVNGVCKECFCGEGHECNFIAESEKLCLCQKNFAEIGGVCKECHCGGGHECEFLNGKKNCLCSPGFSEKNGTCVECYCGNNSVCAFDGEDKVCICDPEMTFKNGMCHEICENDTCERGSCEVEDHHFRCSCDIGFGGDRCDQKLAVSKEASYVIYTLSAVTIIWIILVAVYLIRKRRKREPEYHKWSKDGTPDDGVYLSTVASNADR